MWHLTINLGVINDPLLLLLPKLDYIALLTFFFPFYLIHIIETNQTLIAVPVLLPFPLW